MHVVSLLRLIVLSVVTTLALLAGLTISADMAYAETASAEGVDESVEAPALPAPEEVPEAPRMPEGSFDFPTAEVVEQPPPVQPLAPPPVGEAVAGWKNDRLSSAGLAAIREYWASRPSRSSSNGGTTGQITEPLNMSESSRTGETLGAQADLKAPRGRERFVLQMDTLIGGDCAVSSAATTRGKPSRPNSCLKVCRSSCGKARGNLRLIATLFVG